MIIGSNKELKIGIIEHSLITAANPQEKAKCAFKVVRASNYEEWLKENDLTLTIFNEARARKGYFYEIELLD